MGAMFSTHTDLILDMVQRTERALTDVSRIAVDTGITFQLSDVVDAVERGLPADYPDSTSEVTTRRDILFRIAGDVVSGKAYEKD